VGEYVYKNLAITALLYAGFVVLAAIGLRDWSRALPEARPAAG
jgi:nicotinamide mononucleotide transporter